LVLGQRGTARKERRLHEYILVSWRHRKLGSGEVAYFTSACARGCKLKFMTRILIIEDELGKRGGRAAGLAEGGSYFRY
jgi:hypothetical protein